MDHHLCFSSMDKDETSVMYRLIVWITYNLGCSELVARVVQDPPIGVDLLTSLDVEVNL